jgi:hypothetical protein
MGGHTLSHEECRCLAAPKLQEVTETFCSIVHDSRVQNNSQEDPIPRKVD